MNLKRGYDLPNKERAEGPYPIFSSSGITAYHDNFMAKGPGVITGRYGTIGQVFYSRGDYWPLNTTLYVQDFKGNDPRFIYYFLKVIDLEKFSDKSAVPGINRNDVHTEMVVVPDVGEQRAIASVLSCLDDKIDLLHRQNKTLEAMAETVWRRCFEEGISEGDPTARVGDLVTVKGGTTPSTKNPEFWDGDIRWTSPRDLSNHDSVFLLDTEKKITEKGVAQIGSGLLPPGTVLLSSRAPIGYLAIAGVPMAINQGYIAIVCNKSVSNYFIYLWLRRNMDAITNAAHGSVFPEIPKSTFRSLEVLLPDGRQLRGFDGFVEPLFEKIRSNTCQIRTLAKMRDRLLPKLMSGQMRVS